MSKQDLSQREKIVIGKPYIKKDDSTQNKVLLCSEIWKNGETRTLYFETDEEYGSYFCEDRSDAFLVGLINTAMHEDLDIQCEAGVTEQLLFQLRMYYIPAMAKNFSNMHEISIFSEGISTSTINCNAVGTGNSGGVDSMYTMSKYSKSGLGSFKLSHVIFNNISSGDNDEGRIRKLFERDIPERKKTAEDFGLNFIAMFTNLYSFYKDVALFNHFFTLQYASAAYALAKLFSVFYFSSTWPFEDFSMNEKEIVSGGRFDLFSLDCVSNSSLKFYSAGAEVDRVQKMEYIMHNSLVKKHLQVCAIEQSLGGYQYNKKLNCGHCNKCGRTIAILYANDLLEEYEDIIDTSIFKKNKARFIGQNLAADQRGFVVQVFRLLKNKNKKPKGVEFWRFLYGIRYKLAKNKKLVKIYHKLFKKGR